jgi:hypothetical protein
MRRNRRKLHRELRELAEARKAAIRALRLRQEAERARFEVRPRPARRGTVGPAAPAGAYASHWPSIANLLHLAGVDKSTLGKVDRLCRVLGEQLPEQVCCARLPWLLLHALPTWRRPPEGFRVPRGSARRKREALALHLFAEYPVPAFLLRALEAVEPLPVARVPVEDRWAIDVLAHVGAGGSLRDLAGTDRFPAPLTRRMCHEFLDASADATPILALRRAQVVGSGGPGGLALTLAATRLGALHGPDPVVGEPFWHEVIGWLCRRPGLHDEPPTVLDDLLGWALDQRRAAHDERRGWTLEGRSEASVLREVRQWRAIRALERDPRSLPDSGIPPLVHEDWTIRPVTALSELAEEGQEMRHCVAMYGGLVRRRKVAIFSLRRGGRRVGTIEVALGAGQVVQAKGPANRPLDAIAIGLVRRWAAGARLRCRL